LTANFTARRRYEKVVEESDTDEGEGDEDEIDFSRLGYAPLEIYSLRAKRYREKR